MANIDRPVIKVWSFWCQIQNFIFWSFWGHTMSLDDIGPLEQTWLKVLSPTCTWCSKNRTIGQNVVSVEQKRSIIEVLKSSRGFEILMRKVVVRDFSRDDIRPVWYGGYGETCLLRWLLEPSHLTPVFGKLKFKCIFDTFKIHWNFRRARDHPKYSYRLMITCQTDILVHYEWI